MKKILIVDDEAGIVEELRDFLVDEGFDVRTADTGKEGFDVLARFGPDLLVLDIKLPDMSGLDILRVCKQNSPSPKVIVTTGYVDQNTIDAAEKLGRDAFLQKPFNLEILSQEIERLLAE